MAGIGQGSLDDERASQAHQHLGLNFAMHVGMVPVEPFRHVRGYVISIGELALTAACRPGGGVGAGDQHLVLRPYRRHRKTVHVQVRLASRFVMHARYDGVILRRRRDRLVGAGELAWAADRIDRARIGDLVAQRDDEVGAEACMNDGRIGAAVVDVAQPVTVLTHDQLDRGTGSGEFGTLVPRGRCAAAARRLGRALRIV